MKIPHDFDFTQRKVEKADELQAVAWAEARGWLVRKLKYEGRAGAPDRIFFGHGHIVLIEMKRRGGRVSPVQKAEHARIAEHGCQVHVCWSAEEAIAVLQKHMPLEL